MNYKEKNILLLPIIFLTMIFIVSQISCESQPTLGDDSLAWFDGDQALLDVNDTLTYVCDTMSIVTSDSIRFVFVWKDIPSCQDLMLYYNHGGGDSTGDDDCTRWRIGDRVYVYGDAEGIISTLYIYPEGSEENLTGWTTVPSSLFKKMWDKYHE